MVEKADDPSKVIISYGINDCVPRMIVVDNAEIIQMLFDVQGRLPPSRNDYERCGARCKEEFFRSDSR